MRPPMARTRPDARRRPSSGRPAPRRRSPAQWVLVAGLVAVGVVVVVAALRGDSPDDTASRSGGLTGGDFHSLVADPMTSGRVFVGGHQAVSVSSDAGGTWKRVEALDDADAMGWAFANDSVFVSGHPGLNRSTDGAATFRRTNDGLPDTDVHGFGASEATMYAAGPGLGVVGSTDGGKTWSARTGEAGQSFFGRILIDADDDQQLIAADARAGAVSSADGGRTWRRLGGPQAAVWVSRSGDTLYASGQGVSKSSDGGATWNEIDLPDGATLVEADPTDADVLYAGVHRGQEVELWISKDGGVRWARR